MPIGYIKKLLPSLLAALLVACGSGPSKKPPKKAETPTSKEAAPASLNTTPRPLFQIKTGPLSETLDTLAGAPGVPTKEEVLESLRRDFGDAAEEIDLSKSAEATLAFADDLSGFVVFSLGLKENPRFIERLKVGNVKVDPEGHQGAVRPLPGSLFSPFNRPLYFDIQDGRIIVSDRPQGAKRLPPTKGLSEVGADVEADFASLWFVFGIPYRDAYLKDKQERAAKAGKEKPKPSQEDAFWEAFFSIAESLKTIKAKARPGLRAFVEVIPKKPFPPLERLQGIVHEVVPGSQFGYRGTLPPLLLSSLSDIRNRFAPPAIDSLGAFYPFSNTLTGNILFGGALEKRKEKPKPNEPEKSDLWIAAKYTINDAALARNSTRRYFSGTLQQGQMSQIEPGRTFLFQEAKEKDATGKPVDVIVASMEKPTLYETTLGIDNIEARYLFLPSDVFIWVGKDSKRHIDAMRSETNEPQTLSAALINLLEEGSAAQPGSQPAGSQPASQGASSQPAKVTPFFVAWLSREGLDKGELLPPDSAFTLSMLDGVLQIRIAVLPRSSQK